MGDVSRVAAAALTMSAALTRLIREMRAEPVWQLRHLLAEPACSQVREYADSARRVQNQLRKLEPLLIEMQAVADGRVDESEVEPAALDSMRGIVTEGQVMRESFESFLKWARSLKQVEDDDFDPTKN